MADGLLIFFCGKMGAGKSTLAEELKKEKDGILISEDDMLSNLYPNKISTVEDYKQHADLIKPLVESFAQQMLKKGITVILDFPANTPKQRSWLRGISDQVAADHRCYFIDAPDARCIRQLLNRGNPNTDTEEMFYAMRQFFVAPKDEEAVNLVRV